MNLFQRIGLRMAGIDAAKALNRPAWWGDVGPNPGLGEGGVFGNSPSGWRGAVNSNVWAYNSVKARMSLVAQAPLKMYVGEGDEREEVKKHAALDVLKEVNPINLNARSLMRGIEQQLSIYGRCVVHKVRAIGVKELYILPMEFLDPIPSVDTWLEGYRWLPTGEMIPRADVVDFFYPSANGSVYADSPASVALNSINRYNLADKAQAAIDKRGGQKGGMVIHPKEEIHEDFQRIRDEWDRKRADPESAGRDMHVPFGTDWRGDAFSATEMQREERNQRLAKEIMAAFSVPPAAAGDYRDASVLANAATQMSAFWNMWGIDELKFIAEELTYSLLWAEYKDAKRAGYYFEYDLTDIQALREDADALANRSIILYQGGVSSLNEARELAGLDRAEDPRADIIPIADTGQSNAAPADAGSVMNDTQPADVQPQDTQPADAAPVDMAAAGTEIQQLALNGSQISSLIDVVKAVAAGELDADSAVEIVRVSFPSIESDIIYAMINPVDNADAAGDAEVAALTNEVDSVLAEVAAAEAGQPQDVQTDTPPAKAVGRPERGDMDGDGIFNEGKKPAGGGDAPKVSPVTGRSLAKEGPTEEQKKAAKETEKAQKKAESDKAKAQKKAERDKERERAKAERAKQKDEQAKAKKAEQVAKLDEEAGKLDAAYNSIKDRADVDPKLKQKVIDTIAKVRAKRDAIATGQSEATSSVLQDVARIPAKAELNTGVMVALMLSPSDAAKIEEQIPAAWGDEGVAAEPAGDYHVTLCYLGDSFNFDHMTKAKILASVEYTVQRFTVPAQVTIKGAGRFVNPGGDAIWAGVAADGLANMQTTIVQNLRETGVTIPNDHGDYKPHMTLGYVASGVPATVPPIQPVRATFPSVTVMWGGERYDFPMGGNEAYRSVTAKAFLPVVDFVGMTAVDEDGKELGVIEKIHRFGVHDGIEATKAVPVVMIGGRAFSAGAVKVVLSGEEV